MIFIAFCDLLELASQIASLSGLHFGSPTCILMGGSPLAITFPLSTLERSLPLPIFLYGLFCSFTSEFTAYNLLSPYFVHYSPSPHIGVIRDLHTQLNSTRFFALPFPSPPSNDSLHCTEI